MNFQAVFFCVLFILIGQYFACATSLTGMNSNVAGSAIEVSTGSGTVKHIVKRSDEEIENVYVGKAKVGNHIPSVEYYRMSPPVLKAN